MAIGAHKIGEHLRVGCVRLPAGHANPVAVAVDRLRVHREYLIAGSHQRADEQAPIRLGPDDHFLGLVDPLTDQRVEPRHTVDTFNQTRRRQPLTRLVEHHDVVMVLGPVVTHEDQQPSFSRLGQLNQRGDTNGLMESAQRHDTPPVIHLPTDRQGARSPLRAQSPPGPAVLTRRRFGSQLHRPG
jgi:hypothetical protein